MCDKAQGRVILIVQITAVLFANLFLETMGPRADLITSSQRVRLPGTTRMNFSPHDLSLLKYKSIKACFLCFTTQLKATHGCDDVKEISSMGSNLVWVTWAEATGVMLKCSDTNSL